LGRFNGWIAMMDKRIHKREWSFLAIIRSAAKNIHTLLIRSETWLFIWLRELPGSSDRG
jgi:hypothetical protein